jgi:hypothetical protein
VLRQLETAINWGRYAELFDYDRETGRLIHTTEQPQTEPSIENHDPVGGPKS